MKKGIHWRARRAAPVTVRMRIEEITPNMSSSKTGKCRRDKLAVRRGEEHHKTGAGGVG